MHQYTISINEVPAEIYRFRYEPVDSNMWFVPLGESGLVIDPNINEELLPLFNKYKTKRVQVILTHEHYDHISGVEWIKSKIKSNLFCQFNCAKSIAEEKNNRPKFVAFVLASRDAEDGGHRYKDFKDNTKNFSLHADNTFEDKMVLVIDEVRLECYSTPGHSPGSAVFILDKKYVFTGDSLIQDSPAIVKFPKSDENAYNIITSPFLKSLDKNMLVFPGHGEPFKINEAKYL